MLAAFGIGLTFVLTLCNALARACSQMHACMQPTGMLSNTTVQGYELLQGAAIAERLDRRRHPEVDAASAHPSNLRSMAACRTLVGRPHMQHSCAGLLPTKT